MSETFTNLSSLTTATAVTVALNMGGLSTAVTDVVKAGAFIVFPNPSNNFINVDFTLNKLSNVSIAMMDVAGKTVYSNQLSNLNGNQGLVSHTSSFANGIDTLSFNTNEGTIARKVSIAHAEFPNQIK